MLRAVPLERFDVEHGDTLHARRIVRQRHLEYELGVRLAERREAEMPEQLEAPAVHVIHDDHRSAIVPGDGVGCSSCAG